MAGSKLFHLKSRIPASLNAPTNYRDAEGLRSATEEGGASPTRRHLPRPRRANLLLGSMLVFMVLSIVACMVMLVILLGSH